MPEWYTNTNSQKYSIGANIGTTGKGPLLEFLYYSIL